MKQMKNIVIMGAGGFGTEAVWVIEEMNKSNQPESMWNILGYVDDQCLKKGVIFYGHKTLGTPEEVANYYPGEKIWYYCAIGKNEVRQSVTERLNRLGWQAATLIQPSVIMARDITIGEGTYVGAGSILCPNAVIGKHVLINTRVAIGHDTVLDDFSQACPGAQINGYCKIGSLATIGSNASIFPGKTVGRLSMVGGNSQVIRSVKPNTTVNGVPALVIR